MSHSASPSLHTDHRLPLIQDTEFNALLDTPLKAVVDIFLPIGLVEIGLFLGEEEWVDTTI